jgi:hypothetical protein
METSIVSPSMALTNWVWTALRRWATRRRNDMVRRQSGGKAEEDKDTQAIRTVRAVGWFFRQMTRAQRLRNVISSDESTRRLAQRGPSPMADSDLTPPPSALTVPLQNLEARNDLELNKLGEYAERERVHRTTEEVISQRIYSIVLAIHAAERSLTQNPSHLPKILDLIHTQAEACLEDIRRLASLR